MAGRTRRLLSSYRRAGEAAADAAEPRPEPAEGTDPQVAAFFDIDNTVIRGSSMFHFARGAASHGLLTGRDIAGFAMAQLRFAMFGGEDMDDMAEAVEAGLSFVQGKPASEIVDLAEDVFDEIMKAACVGRVGIPKLLSILSSLGDGEVEEGALVSFLEFKRAGLVK